MKHFFSFLLLLCSTACSTANANADSTLQLEVAAGKQARQHCVVRFQIPPKVASAKSFRLTRTDNSKDITVQLETNSTGNFLYWIVQDQIPAQSKRRYQLQVTDKTTVQTAGSPPTVTLKDDGKKIQINVGCKPVLVYNHATVKSPFPDKPYYAKSGYLHPVYTPTGKVITGDFNADHAHQHGMMFAWRKMNFEGRKTNGWDQKEKTGRVEHAKMLSMESGDVFGTLTVGINHVDLTAKPNPITIINEIWKIRVFAFHDFFLFDVTSTQNCATKTAVVIEEYFYGGMMIRGPKKWNDASLCEYLTNTGKTRANGNHTRPNWVEFHGAIDEARAGITVFDSPENFCFPQPVRLHPKMPYFCFIPAQLGEFSIQPNKPYVSKYQFHIHDGKPDIAANKKLWHNYAEPVSATVIAK